MVKVRDPRRIVRCEIGGAVTKSVVNHNYLPNPMLFGT